MSSGELLGQISAAEAVSRQLDPPEEEVRKMTAEVQDFLLKSLEGSRGGDNAAPGWLYSGPSAAKELQDDGLSEDPAQSMDHLLGLVDRNVLKEGANHSSSRFFGWVAGPGTWPSALGDMLAAASSRFAGYWLANPGAVRMENLLVEFTTKHVAGYDTSKSLGFLSSGASLATAASIVCARDAHHVLSHPEIPTAKFVVYLSSQVHACAQKGLWLVGCCTVQTRYLDVDAQCRIKVESLREHLAKDTEAGLRPWLIIATAGTVNTGSVDPLEEIGELARQYGCWFHIDGAYGGMLKLCPEGAAKIRGTELSDSMVADPHKGMFIPQGTGIVMVKNGEQLKKSHTLSAHYLQPFAEVPDDVVSSSSISPELTKHFRALRMWLPIKYFGLKPFRAAQSEKILLAQYFYHTLSERAKDQEVPFVLGPFPDLSIATYRLTKAGASQTEENSLNQALLQGLLEDGSCFITVTKLPDELVWLRICVLQFRSHQADVDKLISVLMEVGRKLSLK